VVPASPWTLDNLDRLVYYHFKEIKYALPQRCGPADVHFSMFRSVEGFHLR